MGEVQERRYMCRICNKICSSGRSLGGHMRQHSALIPASKKAATSKAGINMDSVITDDQDTLKLEDSSNIRPESAFPCEESLNNCSNTSDSEDVHRNSNYELRDNPKKSCRISDPRQGLSTTSCRECGKEFPTSRALSGHMRSHSIKNKKQIHHCKMCGKGFDSVRGMFGHMKSHPKRSRPVLADESNESLSDFENLCPVRKKRSMIKYKNTISDPNPSCSNMNESDSAVLELGEVEDVAEILIMLSRDVRDWSKFDLGVKSSDNDDGDDFIYFGAGSYSKGKKFIKNDLDFACDVGKGKNVCGLLGLGSVFVVNDEIKVGFGVSDDAQFNLTKIAKREKLNEFSVELVSIKSDAVSLLEESGSEMNSSESEASPGIPKGPEKGKKHQCPICFKLFSSGQALGGHKRAHFKTGIRTENKNEGTMQGVNEEDGDAEVSEESFDLNFPLAIDEGIERDVQLACGGPISLIDGQFSFLSFSTEYEAC